MRYNRPFLSIKTRLSAQPLIWKWFFILLQIKLIFTRKVMHLASFFLLLQVKEVKASVRCYDNSDVIVALIITNFVLYLIQLWRNFSKSLFMATWFMLRLGRYWPGKTVSSHSKQLFPRRAIYSSYTFNGVSRPNDVARLNITKNRIISQVSKTTGQRFLPLFSLWMEMLMGIRSTH